MNNTFASLKLKRRGLDLFGGVLVLFCCQANISRQVLVWFNKLALGRLIKIQYSMYKCGSLLVKYALTWLYYKCFDIPVCPSLQCVIILCSFFLILPRYWHVTTLHLFSISVMYWHKVSTLHEIIFLPPLPPPLERDKVELEKVHSRAGRTKKRTEQLPLKEWVSNPGLLSLKEDSCNKIYIYSITRCVKRVDRNQLFTILNASTTD